jgi:hypothetical protein
MLVESLEPILEESVEGIVSFFAQENVPPVESLDAANDNKGERTIISLADYQVVPECERLSLGRVYALANLEIDPENLPTDRVRLDIIERTHNDPEIRAAIAEMRASEDYENCLWPEEILN